MSALGHSIQTYFELHQFAGTNLFYNFARALIFRVIYQARISDSVHSMQLGILLSKRAHACSVSV
jgi:hypothetical protein